MDLVVQKWPPERIERFERFNVTKWTPEIYQSFKAKRDNFFLLWRKNGHLVAQRVRLLDKKSRFLWVSCGSSRDDVEIAARGGDGSLTWLVFSAAIAQQGSAVG